MLIASSGLFDERWYKKTYSDIESYGGSPLEHFIRHGAAERRAAGPHFDTQAYLQANPEVAAIADNALIHYLRRGAREGCALGPSTSTGSNALQPATFSLILASGDARQTAKTLASVSRLYGVKVELVSHPLSSRQRKIVHGSPGETATVTLPLIAVSLEDDFLQTAIRAAQNSFIVVIEPGDILSEHSLRRIASFLDRQPADVVYSDEANKLAENGKTIATSKPFWSPELLESYNYFGRLTAIRRSVALAALSIGGTEGHAMPLAAAEWDLNLRVTQCTRSIEHLPEILCAHNRLKSSNSGKVVADDPILARVLRDYWKRKGHEATISQAADGTFRATWPLDSHPLVSVIITDDDLKARRRCAEAVRNCTVYPAIEIILIDDDRLEQETDSANPTSGPCLIRTLRLPKGASKARACNQAALIAKGELLLFLSGATDIVDNTWVEDLVRQAIQPGVGVVSAYPSSPNGRNPISLALARPEDSGPDDFGKALVERRPIGSIDTASNQVFAGGFCHILRRRLFDLVDGYDEACTGDGADVLLSLALVRMGFRSIYLPSVRLGQSADSQSDPVPARPSAEWLDRVRRLGIGYSPLLLLNVDGSELDPAPWGPCVWSGFELMQVDPAAAAAPPTEPLDIYDLAAVAHAVKQGLTEIVWPFDPADLRPSLEAGVRILLQFLAFRPDLRRQYRHPIGAGLSGDFAQWVKTEGLRALGLGTEYEIWIDAAYASDLGALPRKILLYDVALRREQPLFLLSTGRSVICERLADAVRDGHLTREAMWWFLFGVAEAPQAALCETWAISPDWQALHPAGGSVFGIERLARWACDLHGVIDDGLFVQDGPCAISDVAQLRLAYAATPTWQQRFPGAMTEEEQTRHLLDFLTTQGSGLPFQPRRWIADRHNEPFVREIVRPGVNVLGHFSYPSGLRVSVENLVAGLHANGVATSLRDVPVTAETDEPIGHHFKGYEIYDTTLIHVQPKPFFDQVYERSGLLPRNPSTYRIGVWYWEIDEVPAAWDRAALQCDEFWAATEFIAAGLRKRYRQPVQVLMPGIEIGRYEKSPRESFGFSDDAFVFLFAFHMTSVMDRKNPLGLIEAFRKGFSHEPRAKLVIKTSFGDHHPESMNELRRAAEGANIIIIDEVYSRAQTLSLMAACDAYVSLHRSEGLGLTMAEAMLLGRPVIATGYSGNLDFMTEDNSLLVHYDLVTIERETPPYELGHQWAKPSTEHAATLMRQLFDDPGHAKRLGRRGQMDLRRSLSFALKGKAMAERLSVIAQMRRDPPSILHS